MTGPSTGPVRGCPFVLCAAQVMLVVEQATPGDDETTLKRVPQHRIEGEAERFGQCPASLMVIPLDAYSRESLHTQAEAMKPMLRPPADPPPPPPSEPTPHGGLFPVGKPAPPDDRWFRPAPGQGTKAGHGGQNVPQQGKAGQSVVPLPDVQHAGPGPGRASKPHQPTAADIVEQHVPPKLTVVPPAESTDQTQQQGSTADMSDNDIRTQLIALTRLAIEGFGQEQESCAALTACLDDTFAVIEKALEEKQKATHSLALAAVGSRSDIPPSAASMIGASASVGSTLSAVRAARGSLQQWIDAAHAYAGSAAYHGEQYLAVI